VAHGVGFGYSTKTGCDLVLEFEREIRSLRRKKICSLLQICAHGRRWRWLRWLRVWIDSSRARGDVLAAAIVLGSWERVASCCCESYDMYF
jgi:hypothetical protein